MRTNKNLILTSDNYFDAIEFQKKTEIEQVAYIMFYVTEVAHLRKDMISDIIADRIKNQYESFFQRNPGASNIDYIPIEKEQVENILKENPTWFQKVNSGVFADSDRNTNMNKAPYRLTQSKIKKLWLLFDNDIKSKIDLQKKRLFIDKALSMILFVICFLLASIYIYNIYYFDNEELVVTSIQDYAKKINLDEYSPTKKGVLFIYYVTELTKMRNEVNATAIHDRIVELQCKMPPQDELDKLLDSTNMLKSQSETPKTYSLTGIGINFAEEVIDPHFKKDTGLNLSFDKIAAIFTAFLSLLGITARAAYSAL